MRAFLVVALWASGHALEQPGSSREKSLASMLLAFQPRTPVARKAVRANPVHAAFPADMDKARVVWGFDAKKKVFDAWEPEKPRDYNNFNPFERNNENRMCDTNGCFPGQSKGYKSPVRPDQDWHIMKEEKAMMEKLKTDPKFNLVGKPGNFHGRWQDNLGAPP